MPTLSLKPTYKSVKDYYAVLEGFARLGVRHESAVRAAGGVDADAGVCVNPRGKRGIVVDGAPVDGFRLMHGRWEAKDEDLSERPRQPIFYGLY